MEATLARKVLAQNPYPHRYTLGMFYREKIRAVTSIMPDISPKSVIDIGGGMSRLTCLLFPDSNVITADPDPKVAEAWSWLNIPSQLIPASATDLPFDDNSFDCATAFDVLEHIPDHQKAADEIMRIVKPDGYILLSGPTLEFRHPYYKPFKKICYTEKEIWEEWGHVRRGYNMEQLMDLFPGYVLVDSAFFVNPLTVIAHDISFSKLSMKMRIALILAQYPITLIGYALGCPGPKLSFAAVIRKER